MDKVKLDGDKSVVEKPQIIDFSRTLNLPAGFAQISKLITRDLNNPRYQTFFTRYSKEDVQDYLANPAKNEKKLRDALIYIYGASSHFMRLVKYFVGLNNVTYVIEPYKIDPQKSNKRIIGNNYRKVLKVISSMNLKTQVEDILTVCMREDVFYGTLWVSDDSITIQRLPSDYCAISSVEENVPNVSFDFSYFTGREYALNNFPNEFTVKYNMYKNRKDKKVGKWIELDSPTSFAIKCNGDILDYPLPPFAGLLREIYDIEDYKQLKKTKTALENYAMLAMKLPMMDDGSWGIDLTKAEDFWSNLDAVLPEEIGSVLTPMEISKISFEKSNTGDTETVGQAEQNLFTAAGVSSLLFNNEKASANALLLSIMADQAITYSIVKRIGNAINRFIHSQVYGKNFQINFLDVSRYNRKEMADGYLKAASYGLPTISAYAATVGIGQEELDSMSFLEGHVLDLPNLFIPVRSSTQMSSDELNGNGATDEGGAPQKEIGDLTDSGEQSREDSSDWG